MRGGVLPEASAAGPHTGNTVSSSVNTLNTGVLFVNTLDTLL